MGRIAAGWGLAKLSLRVVWSDGSLTALVVLGGIASGAVALYRYAAGAGATGPFTERDLEGAVLRKS